MFQNYIDYNPNIFYYSNFNLKISRRARSIILNMQSAYNCTSKALDLCQLCNVQDCYAFRSEVRYRYCLPFRLKQEMQWASLSTQDFISSIEGVCSRARQEYSFLRWSESGDYKSLQDFYKMHAISEGVNLQSYVYTARKDIITPELIKEHRKGKLVINGSNYMLDNMFKVVSKGYTLKRGEVRCKGKCEKCAYCKVKGNRVIVNEQH